MTLAPFAVYSDVQARLGRILTTAEQAQATAFLEDASQIIRDYCRQDFNAQTGLVATFESPDGPWLDLPQRPVTHITSVLVNGQAVGNYSQVGDRLYRVYGWRWPSVDTIPPLAIYGLISTVAVTYDAGYNPIPPVVVSTCIAMALAALSNPTGLTREAIDDYSREMPTTAAGVSLTESQMRQLKRYRRGAFTIDMGSSVV